MSYQKDIGTTDHKALLRIQEILRKWNIQSNAFGCAPETLNEIATVIEDAGYSIEDIKDDAPDDYEPTNIFNAQGKVIERL